jgi:hypothetical protein
LGEAENIWSSVRSTQLPNVNAVLKKLGHKEIVVAGKATSRD